MTPHLLLSLFQDAALAARAAASSDTPFREIGIYFADAAALGAFGFAWRANAALVQLRTMLMDPDMGLASRFAGASKQVHDHATTLQGHEVTLDTHGREIARLDREKEPRRDRRALGPEDVGTLDRRGT